MLPANQTTSESPSPKTDPPVRILLIHSEQREYLRLSHILASISSERYQLTWCGDMALAMEALLGQLHDVIFLDYNPQAGQRLLASANHQGCTAPIIVMTEQMDSALDHAAIKAGAADYLIKSQVDGFVLERAIRYALDRKEAELKLAKLAHYDALSGVPNRVLFGDRLRRAIQRAERGSYSVGLLFLDFDGFKNINDSYGHAAGDRLIALIAERLSACMRRTDSVARLGGDEFTVVLEELHSVADVVNVAKKILRAIDKPFSIAGHQVVLGCSIGIAQFPEAGRDVETLLKNADLAMYQAKQVRGSAYRFYTDAMNEQAVSQQNIEDQLHSALHANELQLYLQPRIDMSSGSITGLQSVLYWKHPERGLVHPHELISFETNSRLRMELDYWVLTEACRLQGKLKNMGCTPIHIAINLPVKLLHEANFLSQLPLIVKQTGADARQLRLELDESALVAQVKQSRNVMLAVNRLGPKFVLDNFGSGFSSLPQLQKLPFVAVKIGQSLVQNFLRNDDDARIIRAMISLGKSLDLQVIAEAADSAEQARFLQDNGCDQLQGQYFSPALSFDTLCQMLEEKQLIAAHES